MLAALTDTRLAPLVAFLFLAVVPATPATDAIGIVPAARAVQPGELVVLTFTTPAGADRVRVQAFGRDVPAVAVGDDTWRALVGIDLNVAPGSYDVTIDAFAGGDPVHGLHTLDVGEARFETRHLKVADAYVDPPAATRARIVRDAAALAGVWKATAPAPLWSGPFVRPVEGDVVSSFGKRSVLNGRPRGAHGGADFRGAAGTRILVMHQPDGLTVAGDEPFDLALCGHVHGGQYLKANREPAIRHKGPISKLYMHGGVFHTGARDAPVLVSRGVGTSTLPARRHADPQVHICTVVAARE